MSQDLTFNLGVDTNSAVSSINQFFSAFDQGAAQAQSKLNSAFGQPIKTEVQITMKGGDVAAKKIESMSNTSTQLKSVVKALNGEWGKTPAALNKQVQVLTSLKANTQKYATQTGKVTAEWNKVTQALALAKQEAKKFNDEGTKGGSGLVANLIKANLAATAIEASFRALTAGIGDLFSQGMEFQALSIQMEGFTGSSEAATMAFQDFADIAAGTPFNLKQVAQAGKILMAFGLDSQTATKETERLGIVAAATGGDLQLMARNLGQIAAQGQAYTRDLTQFAIQGIPIWQAMSDVTGKNVTQLKAMAAEGQISFGIVQQAIQDLTQEGSAYSDIYEEMQKSLIGQLAQLESAWQMLSKSVVSVITEFDQAMGGFLSGSLATFIENTKWLAQNLPGMLATILKGFQQWTPVLATLGGLMAAVAAPTIIASMKAYLVALGAKIAATWLAVKAQTALLLAMGPAGWAAAATGAALLAVAVVKIGEEAGKAATALDGIQADWDKQTEGANNMRKSLEGTNATLDETGKKLDQNSEKMNELNQKAAMKEAKESAKEYYSSLCITRNTFSWNLFILQSI